MCESFTALWNVFLEYLHLTRYCQIVVQSDWMTSRQLIWTRVAPHHHQHSWRSASWLDGFEMMWLYFALPGLQIYLLITFLLWIAYFDLLFIFNIALFLFLILKVLYMFLILTFCHTLRLFPTNLWTVLFLFLRLVIFM